MSSPVETLDAFSSDYKLGRDEGENLRLSCQHWVLKRRQGWLLHPKVQKTISDIKNPQIADIACGTGIWSIEVAEQYPEATVTGLDISAAQFPAAWTLPSNTTLDLLDFTKALPQEHRGKYDVVHCRLLLQAGPNVDPLVWVKNFESLLKPGGWLQWEEPLNPPFQQYKPAPGTNADATKPSYQSSIVRMDTIADVFNLASKVGWFEDFEGWMERNTTLQDIKLLTIPIYPPTAKIEMDVLRRVSVDISNRLSQIADLDEPVREKILDEGQGQMNRIQADGAMVAFRWVIGLARAP